MKGITSCRQKGSAGGLLAFAIAAVAYVTVAWTIPPGFYDCCRPTAPYHWVSPPPNLASGNQPAQPGHNTLKLGANGVVEPGTVFTGESQPQLSFSVLPGAFPAATTIDITPESSYPPTAGLQCETNVYRIAASQPLVKEALVTMRYSDAVPAPSEIYRAAPGGGWAKLGSTSTSAPFYISARTTELGYFVACFPASSTRPPGGPILGGGQTLPILVALTILLVLLGGIPLALLNRRVR